MRALYLVAIAVTGCDRIGTESAPVSSAGTSEPAQCLRDDDCVLLPSQLTCCIECPPAPPFEAAPGWVLDGMLIESETACAEATRLCPRIHCEPVPAACTARAACVEQRCTAVTEGCLIPTS
jgi:hypothetical protein